MLSFFSHFILFLCRSKQPRDIQKLQIHSLVVFNFSSRQKSNIIFEHFKSSLVSETRPWNRVRRIWERDSKIAPFFVSFNGTRRQKNERLFFKHQRVFFFHILNPSRNGNCLPGRKQCVARDPRDETWGRKRREEGEEEEERKTGRKALKTPSKTSDSVSLRRHLLCRCNASTSY